MNIWAVGDIHGYLSLLDLLLKKLVEEHGLNLKKDKLIFLGDYIDRGPDSPGVHKRVMELDKNPNVVCLLGNHDDFMLDANHTGVSSLWTHPCNGGSKTLRQYGLLYKVDHYTYHSMPEQLPQSVIDWTRSLPLFHKEHGFFFSHACILRRSDEPYGRDDYLWSRPRICAGGKEGDSCKNFGTEEDGTKIVGVCGHTKAKEPRFYDNYWFLDSGCGALPDGKLTAIECRSQMVVQADPKELENWDHNLDQLKDLWKNSSI